MPLQCNIDARGKRLRFVNALILLLAGILMVIFWAIPAGTALAWIVSVAVLAVGTFVLFEARSGWCALRAMGWKTPI